MNATQSGASVHLESPLPASLPEGTALALYCSGTAWADDRPVAALRLTVDGEECRVDHVGMPRFDMPERRSGFWGVVPVPARPGATVIKLGAAVIAHNGERTTVDLGQIEVAPAATSSAEDADLIAICMATFEPDLALFRAQIESVRTQRDRHWTCVISDDFSRPESYDQIVAIVGDDDRFAVSRAPSRIGFYRNFERALTLVPPEAGLVALCDQDDVWHPDKLTRLRAGLGSAELVYSDQRLVDERGRVLRESLWVGRANNRTSMASLLVANTVTGAASLFRRAVAETALPFPDSPGIEFHDHWIALVALARGALGYVPAPLYDYVQHRQAILGKVTEERGERRRLGFPRARRWRAAYFLGYVPGEVRARTLLLRCADSMTPAKRRDLERYVASQSSVMAFLWFAARPLRMLAGRTETLGTEWELTVGLVWQGLARLAARRPGWPDRLTLDCRFPDPPRFEQRRLRRWRERI
jgi:glycosyltransferase involved in cell wall biosynthesis